MSRQLASIVTLAAMCAMGVRSADAQQPQAQQRQQYSVVASEGSFILVDPRSGQTWLLAHPPSGGTPAWVPIQRIDNPEEAEHWREEQDTLAEQRLREHHEHHEQQQQELRERLEERRREMTQRREEFDERARREREQREQREREADDREPPPGDSPEPEASSVREHLQRLGEQTHRAMTESLRSHRERLVEQFGEDHPAVDAISKQIEQLRRELQKLTDEADPSAKPGGDARSEADSPQSQKLSPGKQADPQAQDVKRTEFTARIQDALSLMMEEMETFKKHGVDHPRVKELRNKIEVLERILDNVRAKEQEADSNRKDDQPSQPDGEDGTQGKAETDSQSNAGSSKEELKQPREDTKNDTPSEGPPAPELKQKATPQAKDSKRPAAQGPLKRFKLHLQDLRSEKESLQESYGAEHPKVRAVQLKIELFENVLEESQLGELAPELMPLLLEELTLREKFGPKHPEVQAVRKKIERKRKQLDERREQENRADSKLIGDQPAEPDSEPDTQGDPDSESDEDSVDPAEDR